MELIVFVGLQASGKTTFFRRYFSDTHAHVSKDNFRKASRPKNRQEWLIREALENGWPVVVDNTNASIEVREPLIRLGREHGVLVVAYWFNSTIADSRTRNARRTGAAQIPLVGLYTTAKKLNPPTMEEGFDALFQVTLAPSGFTVRPNPI